MNVRNMLLAATVLVLPTAAMAGETVNGFYVGLGAGFDMLNPVSTNGVTEYYTHPNSSYSYWGGNNLNSNGGWGVVGSVGYGFGDVFNSGGGVRVELEGNYRQNKVHLGNHATLTDPDPVYGGPFSIGGGGMWQQYGVMVNALYDFTTVAPWVTPYVGLGFGYIWNNFQGGNFYDYGGFSYNFSGNNQGSAAGQFILGAAFPLGVPGLSLTTEFRFLGQFSGNTLKATPTYNGVPTTNPIAASAKFGSPTNESLLIGLRYAFNTAPPPPPPAPAPVYAPAPAPSRTYLVFFDWDRADLTGRARQIIAEAAQASTRVQVTQIEVSGYADRTGTAQYNLALSRRRADNVAGELVRLGVPRNVISIQAFGDTHLLVPTAEGVREPQNRRVEIILK